ncbi:hypothetical protein GCM10010297_22850 [Streptomyces malachitofuscus]|nr:hypothetical protein GCM10010297_22850 [Streptomyces malachitofuscus]
MEVATIQGQAYTNELRADQLDVLTRPVREALDVYDLGADPDIRARLPEELCREAENLCADVRTGNIKSAATRETRMAG